MDVFNFLCRTREAKLRLEQHRLRLYRIAYSWTHHAALADDLVQETLTKAMQKSSQLRDPNAGEAWLYSILANCYHDHFRRHRASEEIDNNTLIDESTPEKESSEQEIVLKVRAAIAKLSEGQRQVVTLVDIQGLSYMEVAQILNVPIGTVMSRLCRARQTLKDLLADLSPKLADEVKIRRIK
ncbi:MAG: sigma-70 family RNA polymerase sigma factor [Gammaproteobacteria bacterium]|nr:sigma-70 family RNA polymerase sigma factor [Gammaproteobacteria bacterium]